jgi:hypothetical protein
MTWIMSCDSSFHFTLFNTFPAQNRSTFCLLLNLVSSATKNRPVGKLECYYVFFVYGPTPFQVIKKCSVNMYGKRDMVNCSNCDCSKNLLDTILLLLDTIRAIIFFLVICSNPVNLWG